MSNSNRSLSVVLPVFNEEGAIGELISRVSQVIRKISDRIEIVAVDDGSRDRTLEKLKTLQSSYPELVVVELSRNYGQTAALAAGIDRARGDVIVTMDADLQHDPNDITRLVAKLDEGYDIVSGWREKRSEDFFLRRLPSLVANSMMRTLSGIKIRDFASTFKAYRGELIKQIELFGELHRFIPVLAHRIGARMVEIPIVAHPRTVGKSNYGISRVFGVFEDLVFLEFYANYLTKPIRGFGRLFVVFFSTGFLISLVLMLLWAAGTIKGVLEHGALLLFSLFLMIIGVQFLVTGILAELLSRVYLQTGGRKIYSVRSVFGGGNIS